MDSSTETLNEDPFELYRRMSFFNVQAVNNEVLREILQKNGSCALLMDKSTFYPLQYDAASVDDQYAWVDEFRQKVPLTGYEYYRDYIDRMINNGEKNLLSSEDVVYFSLSSGTTAGMKKFPLTATAMRKMNQALRLGHCILQKSLSITSPSYTKQRKSFTLLSSKKSKDFPRSRDGVPIGPISQSMSTVALFSQNFPMLSTDNTLALDIIEDIPDFETSIFIQLVFALANCDIDSYSVPFASICIRTVKLIENYYEEISYCIESNDFNHSSRIKQNISDSNLILTLNQRLMEVIVEHGGESYRKEQVQHIRTECVSKNLPGIIHRLWPTLRYVCTAIGSTFSMYKDEIQFYCGTQLPLVNLLIYGASEGFFGALASAFTDEYFLLPTHAFFEFISEEDIKQEQPKTLLISEIEPGHRYELVCTTDSGLVRYRMGDVINCTRFLSRADDLVPLAEEPAEIPRVPLISLAYRTGTLLSINGERTNEQHVMTALEQTVNQWKEQGIPIEDYEFSSYAELNASPSRYVIFLELILAQHCEISSQQVQVLKNTVKEKVEQNLRTANEIYEDSRRKEQLGPLDCILVQIGTFDSFLRKVLKTDGVSLMQIKPHRMLQKKDHIKFFHDHAIHDTLF